MAALETGLGRNGEQVCCRQLKHFFCPLPFPLSVFYALKAKPHLLEHGYKSAICVHLRSCVAQPNWIAHKTPSIWPEVLTHGSLRLRGNARGCKLSDAAWALFSSQLKCSSIINLLDINVSYINAQAIRHIIWAHSSGNWGSLELDAVKGDVFLHLTVIFVCLDELSSLRLLLFLLRPRPAFMGQWEIWVCNMSVYKKICWWSKVDVLSGLDRCMLGIFLFVCLFLWKLDDQWSLAG